MLLLLAALTSPAHADDDDNFFFVGGAAAIRPGYGPVLYPAPSQAEGLSLWGEAEADLRFQAGIVSGRLDLDFAGTVLPDVGIVKALPDVPVIDTVRPEWAMIQAGGETWVARGGIVNAAMGLEDWDDWAMYMPTHGQYFAFSPGRMAGSEVGWTFGDDGPTVSIGGGADLDWDSEGIVEANVSYEGDAASVYSGVAVYPGIQRYAAVLGAEAYPAEFVTLALGGMAGVDGASPFTEVSLYGVFLPEAIVKPTVRLEAGFDPDGVTGGAPWAASVGGAINPTPYTKILLEGKLLGTAGDPVPGVYASLCIFRPEPGDDEEGDDAGPDPDDKD